MSALPVLTAVTDPGWEAGFLEAAQRRELGIVVVRRCLDLPELLSAASTGTARAALVDAELRHLDADALARLARCGVAPVVRTAEPAPALARVGARAVPHAASAEAVAVALQQAASTPPGDDPAAPLAGPPISNDTSPSPPANPNAEDLGRVIAVWGPTGAPGRSTVALNVAAEVAAARRETLLVDADPFGGSIAQLLGLLDESPGLAAAARHAGLTGIDPAELARFALQVRPSLRVLTGIGRAERWPELRPAAVEAVLASARALAAVTVVDCGFDLEREDGFYDSATPHRSGATLAALAAVDVVLAVGAADPVGLQRLVRGLSELREVAGEPVVVVNKTRPSIAAGAHGDDLRAALARHAGAPDAWLLPWDQGACDAALLFGQTLAEAAPRSALRASLRALAATADRQPQQRRRGLLGRRVHAGR